MRPVGFILLLVMCCGCASATGRQESAHLRKLVESLEEKDDAQPEALRFCRWLLKWTGGRTADLHFELLDLSDTKTFGAAAVARADAAAGRLVVFTSGLPKWDEPEVVDALRREFGVEYERLSFCVAPKSIWRFMDAYNDVSCEAIKKKTGKTFGELLESKPLRAAFEKVAERRRKKHEQYEKWLKREAERKKKRLEILKKDVWPLLEKGDFAKARETAGDDFTDSYREYLESMHPEIFKIEMAYPNAPLTVDFVDFLDTPVADAIEFLNAWARPIINPLVLEVPETRKTELLERPVTLRISKVPFSAVVMQVAKQAGLRVRVESKRIVLHLPEKK